MERPKEWNAMPHALVTGDRQRCEQIRLRLEMLGLTVAVVDPAAAVPASVGECDLLVHDSTARHAVVPRQAAGELPDAPVVLLGDSRPGPWSCVAWEDLDGPAFAAAVRSCVHRAWELRGASVPSSPSVRYREFLAHELRSPLAVVAAALEALDSGLIDGSAASGDDARSVVDRALRNVRRLERTVEWSQSSLVLAEVPPVGPRQVLDLAEVADLLQDLGCQTAAVAGADGHVETDPDLLHDVVRQMIRVCHCREPGARPVLHLEAGDPEWVIRLSAAPVEGGVNEVSRCGLVRPGEPISHDSLLELAYLLIPAAALHGLDARLLGAPGEPGVLELRLPVAVPVPTG